MKTYKLNLFGEDIELKLYQHKLYEVLSNFSSECNNENTNKITFKEEKHPFECEIKDYLKVGNIFISDKEIYFNYTNTMIFELSIDKKEFF